MHVGHEAKHQGHSGNRLNERWERNKLKKVMNVIMMAMLLGLIACSSNGEEQAEGDKNVEQHDESAEKEPLTLQVLKGDEEAGATIENNNIYNELNQYVQAHPDIGLENDFSLYIVNTIQNESGDSSLVMLGINRLPTPIKNISFDFTLGNKDGEYVWENFEVTMDEETAGVLNENSTFPIVLSLTDEQKELLRSLNQENQVMKIENFQYEEG